MKSTSLLDKTNRGRLFKGQGKYFIGPEAEKSFIVQDKISTARQDLDANI